ncbi:MAG: glycosyltransferase family 2 protein [Coriobacteriia bacterium]|nr:glycosyltransferase family 2 protein [Coriobacteriia bacterium]
MGDIAIVVAAYNAQDTLARAIESVRGLTDPDWQLVVVDDGSNDDTYAIATRFAQHESRISVVRQENAGTGMARNAGIRATTTEWIAYLDADDMLAPEWLTVMKRTMEQHSGYDIYCSNGWFVDADGGREPIFSSYEAREITLDDILRSCCILGGGALVNRQVLDGVGGFANIYWSEDYNLWVRLLVQGARAYATAEKLYLYHRAGDGRKSNNAYPRSDSVVQTLTHAIDTGTLTEAQEQIARAGIASAQQRPHMEAQKRHLRLAVTRIVGERYADIVMRTLHRFAWVVRPLRRRAARGRVERQRS